MKFKNKPLFFIILLFITFLIISSYYFYLKTKNKPTPYSSPKGFPISVSKDETPFNLTATQLQTNSDACGHKQEKAYFENILSNFTDINKIIYTFKYQGNSQDNSIFTVTLVPNKIGYSSVEQFKKDFDLCFAGGDFYPTAVSHEWLFFTSSCGSGFDDNSGRVHGCEEIKKFLEPILK